MRTILDSLEQKWRSILANHAPPPLAVGGAQFFAWDEDREGEGTVVCIGANYTQYPEKAHFPTKTTLTSWFSNYRYAANLVGSAPWQSAWSQHGWLVGPTPPLRPRYFVLTNLVPWITSRSWTQLSQTETVGLIHLAWKTVGGYLDDLAQELPNAFAVGHGIDKKTLPYLPGAASKWNNWMLYANLSYPQTPSSWDASQSRFCF